MADDTYCYALRAPRAILPAAFALLFVVPPTPAMAQNYVRFHRYYDGDKLLFCFEAPMARVKKLPLWDGKGEPPMSRDRAIEIGAEHLRSGSPRVAKFKPHRVELDQIDVRYDIFDGIVWYYLIEYAAETDGDARLSSTEYLAIVLFDGKPVPKTMGKCTPLSQTFAPKTALLTDALRSAPRAPRGAARHVRWESPVPPCPTSWLSNVSLLTSNDSAGARGLERPIMLELDAI